MQIYVICEALSRSLVLSKYYFTFLSFLLTQSFSNMTEFRGSYISIPLYQISITK